jgi:hypothetical protein
MGNARLSWSTPEQALGIGLAAAQVARFDIAQAGFQKAADAKVPGADIELANEIGASGHPEAAVRLLTEALARRQHDGTGTIRIRSALARYTQESGDSEAADVMFGRLIGDCHSILGPDHLRLSRVPWNFGGGPLIIRLPSDPHSGLRR